MYCKRVKKKKTLSRVWLFFFFFFLLDWNGGFLSSEFPDVCCVWFGSISVTANMWRGLEAVWDQDVPKLCTASRDSQALCYRTGLLPSVFCVLSSCIVCCSICTSCCQWCFLQADIVGGALLDTQLSFHCEFLSAHCSHLNDTLVQLRQCSSQNGCSPSLCDCLGSHYATEETCHMPQDQR